MFIVNIFIIKIKSELIELNYSCFKFWWISIKSIKLCLGLSTWGLYFCSKKNFTLGSIFFVLALNIKQMSLYFALPFFIYILGNLIFNSISVHRVFLDLIYLENNSSIDIILSITTQSWIHSYNHIYHNMVSLDWFKRTIYVSHYSNLSFS